MPIGRSSGRVLNDLEQVRLSLRQRALPQAGRGLDPRGVPGRLRLQPRHRPGVQGAATDQPARHISK